MHLPPHRVTVRGFTIDYHGMSNVLRGIIHIGPAFDPASGSPPPCTTEFQAIWDTGATGTVITPKVVKSCALMPIGMANVHTVNGSMVVPRYLVSILLPNNVVVGSVGVTEGKLTIDTDVLIGMDIIGLGDFIISNNQNRTVFSFRIPSIGIEFPEQKRATPSKGPIVSAVAKVRRNDPCPCGSGKKYKKCCGK